MTPSPEREHLIALTTSQAELVMEVLRGQLPPRPRGRPATERDFTLAAAVEAIDEALHPISSGDQA